MERLLSATLSSELTIDSGSALLSLLAVSASGERNARHSVVTDSGQSKRDQTCNDKLFKHGIPLL
jgi:hypothetical protein